MITDVINMLINPIWSNIFQVAVDIAHFYVVPILGGIFAIVVKAEYEEEAISYDLAGLNMMNLYGTNMSLIKDGIYTLVGRPFIFDVNPLYAPPQSPDVTKLPGWI